MPTDEMILEQASAVYPGLLRRVCDPPERLWVLGRLPSEPCIAIVGSRACSD